MFTTSMVTGIAAVALSVGLAACGATNTKIAEPDTAQETTAAPSAAPPDSALAVPDRPSGSKKTIADYVAENKIIESPVKQGDPDAPTFDFPMPPDWRAAGAQKPEWAYGAIVYDKAKDPADPPFMTAVVNKFTGDVDPAEVLEYAPGLLQNLPGYQQDGEVTKTTFSGFDAIVFQGSYLQDQTRRYIAQMTVVIPGREGALFVLQLNADAPAGQEQAVRDGARVIERDTTITV